MGEPRTLTPEQSRRWTRMGALAAVAMLLGYLETFVPIPIPGVKLGLANVAVLVALGQGDLWGATWVALIKVAAAGLLFGSPMTLAYSAAGTALSLAVMVPLSRLKTMRLEMCSIVGALAHEAGQLLVAQVMLGTPLVWYSAPALYIAGCLTGLFDGLVATRSLALLEQPSQAGHPTPHPHVSGDAPDASDNEALSPHDKGNGTLAVSGRGTVGKPFSVNPHIALLILIIYCIIVLRNTILLQLCGLLMLALFACVVTGVTTGEALRALRPMALVCAITFVAQLWVSHGGHAVLSLGPLVVTREGLGAVAASSLRLTSLTYGALAFSHALSLSDAGEAAHWATTPLRMVGIDTQGPELAIRSAVGLLPLLATELGCQRRFFKGMSPREALDLLPRFVVRALEAVDEVLDTRI